MTTRDQKVDVYTFGPAWGIPVPTPSPFGLKVLTWMRMHEVPYTLHVENDPGKGPKKKCPWALVGGELLGDSELIIAALKRRLGIEGDTQLSREQRALATATRLMLEEHYHQVWEHELFIHEGGWARGKEFFDQLPAGIKLVVRTLVRGQLRRQLFARGVGRHDHERIVDMGIEVLDSIDALLGDDDYFFGDEPTEVDASIFGFLALTHWTPVRSRLWDDFRSRERLVAYCERMRERYFPEGSE